MIYTIQKDIFTSAFYLKFNTSY